MAKRSTDWNEGLAEDLRDPAFAREFLLAAVEEGIAVQEALGKGDPRDGGEAKPPRSLRPVS